MTDNASSLKQKTANNGQIKVGGHKMTNYPRIAAGILTVIVLTGCTQRESVTFHANASQTPVVRDGRPAIVSKMKNSVVLLAPANRELVPGTRPVYILAATNLTAQPIDLRIANIQVTQNSPSGATRPLQVITYEQLAQEERTRQVIGAILVGAAGAANSYSASRAGYGTYRGNVYTARGNIGYSGTYFNPAAAAAASANAAATNEAMIANTIARGQANMAMLERNVLKDNSVMPGEWIGGQIHFAPPEGDSGNSKQYSISIALGGEIHEINISQGPKPGS